MTREIRVHFVRSAARQVREAADWWNENRPAAPDAVKRDLREAVSLLKVTPSLGEQARNVRLKGVRRVHLSRVGHHLYYRLIGDQIEVLAFWHVRRGTGPKL